MSTKRSYVVTNGIITNCIIIPAGDDPTKYRAVSFPEGSPQPSIGWEVVDGMPRAPITEPTPPTPDELKILGIEFNGVMCSATAEDMWGLASVRHWVVAGNPVNFKFNNGNILTITIDNLAAFEAVWVPFRASFF